MKSPGPKDRGAGADRPTRATQRARAWRLIVLVGAALLLRFLVANHVDLAGDPGFRTGLNGSRFWYWPWRQNLPKMGRLLGLMLAALTPLAAAGLLMWRRAGPKGRIHRATAVGLIVIGSFAMQMAAMAGGDGDGSIGRVGQIVHSQAASSYFNDAATQIQTGVTTRNFLGHYPQWMDSLTGHNRNKPPGPTLYYRAWISMFGDSSATAQWAGITLAALAALTAAATYGLVLSLGYDAQTAVAAAMFWALCPGPVVMLPELDQVYGLFTCAIVGTWAMGLGSGGSSPARAVAWGAAAGILMAMGLLMTYAFLVLAFILMALAIAAAIFDDGPGRRRAMCVTAAAVGAFVAFYAVLWLISGFDPIATFTKIRSVQSGNLAALQRVWPNTIGWDLLDFTLCSGWLGCLLAGMFLIGGRSRWRSKTTGWIAAAMVVQILLIGITGVLQSEVTRLWIFVLPLLAVPVGLELRQWDRSARLAAFICMWILLTTVVANIQFIVLPP